MVQDDLFDFAELIFDLTETAQSKTAYQAMVKDEYFQPNDQSESPQASRQWYWSQLTFENFKVQSICENPINTNDIQKYENTILALQSGKIKERYNKVTEYRIDSESEERVKNYNTWMPITITFWSCVMIFCSYKLYRFRKNILTLKFEINFAKNVSRDTEQSLLKLIQLKKYRQDQLERERLEREQYGTQQPNDGDDANYDALADLVGGSDAIAGQASKNANHLVLERPEIEESDEFENDKSE